MSFFEKFESKEEGVNDTIEWILRLAVFTLSCVIMVVIVALVAGLFVSNDIVDSNKVFEIIGPAFNTVIGAFVGLLGGLSLNANARDPKKEEPAPEVPAPTPAPLVEDDHEDSPTGHEAYRHDLRWDTNNDGVVDEKDDLPDWMRK